MSSKFNDERVKQVLSTATVFEVTPQECHVEKYGRPCDTKRVKKMVKNWNQLAMEMPLLAELSYNTKTGIGQYATINGQHRIKAFSDKRGADQVFTAQVIDEGKLSYEERAELYSIINNEQKKPSPIDNFLARIEFKDDTAVTIYEIVKASGVKIGGLDNVIKSNKFPITGAISRVEKLYSRGTLSSTLRILYDSYLNTSSDHSNQAFGEKMLMSIDQIVYAYRHPSGEAEYDEERLIKTISVNPAKVWVGQSTIGMTAERKQVYASESILVAYNKSLPRSKQLDTSKVFERNYNQQTRKAYGLAKG
jgi:hypothetical protein